MNKEEIRRLKEEGKPMPVVSTRHGKGKIKTINSAYSVPLYLVELINGRFKGDTLALMEMELEEE